MNLQQHGCEGQWLLGVLDRGLVGQEFSFSMDCRLNKMEGRIKSKGQFDQSSQSLFQRIIVLQVGELVSNDRLNLYRGHRRDQFWRYRDNFQSLVIQGKSVSNSCKQRASKHEFYHSLRLPLIHVEEKSAHDKASPKKRPKENRRG